MEYIIEIIEPTNNPGNYITKFVFTEEEKARKVYKKLTEGFGEVIPSTEWDDKGPNWKNLETRASYDDDTLITLDEVDTEKALKELTQEDL